VSGEKLGPFTLRKRVNEPTADILRGLPDEPWGFVIWKPHPPFVFGQVAAIVCTAPEIPDGESESIARLMTAAPELLAALKAWQVLVKQFDQVEVPLWAALLIKMTVEMTDAAVAKCGVPVP